MRYLPYRTAVAILAAPDLTVLSNCVVRKRLVINSSSLICMSTRVVENSLFTESKRAESKLLALILNYTLPKQVQKLLQKGAELLYTSASNMCGLVEDRA